MKITDLITDVHGNLSHTKIWSNIAYATGTIGFLIHTLRDAPPSLDVWFAYLGILGGSNVASKFITAKYNPKV